MAALDPGTVATELLQQLKNGEARFLSMLAEATGRTKRQVSDAAGQLRDRGLLTLESPGYYRLTKDGVSAAAEGLQITSGPTGKTGARRTVEQSFRQRAWLAMRVRRQFTLSDIIGDASNADRDPRNNLVRFVRYLVWAGYVTELRGRQKGTKPGSNGFKRYRLSKNTGRKAPVYSEARKTLRDLNTGEEFACDAPR